MELMAIFLLIFVTIVIAVRFWLSGSEFRRQLLERRQMWAVGVLDCLAEITTTKDSLRRFSDDCRHDCERLRHSDKPAETNRIVQQARRNLTLALNDQRLAHVRERLVELQGKYPK